MKSVWNRFSLLCIPVCFLALSSQQQVVGQEASLATDAAPTVDVALPATDDEMAGSGPVRRYDWFHGVWNKRRTTFAKRVESDKGAVVFFGDSITQGWGDDFRGQYEGMKTANTGISGDTTRGMLHRLHEDVIAREPAAVVMLMGTNDLEEHAQPSTIAANVKLIIKELKKHDPELPIVWCDVFPSSASKTRPADKIKEVNRLVHEAVKGDAQVSIVDTWTLFANEDGDAKKEEFPDLLHPNQLGYAKWRKALLPQFATLGFIETEADDFQLEEGFESLFNGKDLSGWGYRITSEKMKKGRDRWKGRPEWPIVEKDVAFGGKVESNDGRYIAKNGRLVVTNPPEHRKIQQLWTTRAFAGDFKLILEFRAMPNADSGVFIREPQLQCRDYALAGPYKKLSHYRPQEWNELVVEVKQGVALCTCNGEVLEKEFKVPATGPIGLEGDRGQVEYRRIRIKQLGE